MKSVVKYSTLIWDPNEEPDIQKFLRENPVNCDDIAELIFEKSVKDRIKHIIPEQNEFGKQVYRLFIYFYKTQPEPPEWAKTPKWIKKEIKSQKKIIK